VSCDAESVNCISCAEGDGNRSCGEGDGNTSHKKANYLINDENLLIEKKKLINLRMKS
jgi:hypothetical protein